MTKEKQLIALAKLDGFEIIFTDTGRIQIHHSDGRSCAGNKDQLEAIFELAEVPKYLISRDAIVPLIEKQFKDDDSKKNFFRWLYDQHTGEGGIDLMDITEGDELLIAYYILLSKPEQLAEALLRATNLWEEE